MSRHKLVKNLDLDDELDDYDGYDEDEGTEGKQGRIRAISSMLLIRLQRSAQATKVASYSLCRALHNLTLLRTTTRRHDPSTSDFGCALSCYGSRDSRFSMALLLQY